jgi:hypothetical protein
MSQKRRLHHGSGRGSRSKKNRRATNTSRRAAHMRAHGLVKELICRRRGGLNWILHLRAAPRAGPTCSAHVEGIRPGTSPSSSSDVGYAQGNQANAARNKNSVEIQLNTRQVVSHYRNFSSLNKQQRRKQCRSDSYLSPPARNGAALTRHQPAFL